MTEPTTQTLVELRRRAEAVRDAKLPHPKWLAENAFKAAFNYGTVIELLDALEAQARESERLEALHVTTMMDELQPALEERDTLRAELAELKVEAEEALKLHNSLIDEAVGIWKERDNLLEQLAAAQKEGLELRAELTELQTEKLELETQLRLTCSSLVSARAKPVGTVESAVMGAGGFHVRLEKGAVAPRVGDKLYTSPVVDVNAGLVGKPKCKECHNWREANQANKEWHAGVVKGREIVSDLSRTQQAPKGGE